MKQSIGLTQTLNIIIIFLAITFAFLIGIVSYYKAFKVSSKIASSIENSEGYNSLSKKEISLILDSLGYKKGRQDSCPSSYGTDINNLSYNFCLYEKTTSPYVSYGIVTFISLDLPIVDHIGIPVYYEARNIYKFKE